MTDKRIWSNERAHAAWQRLTLDIEARKVARKHSTDERARCALCNFPEATYNSGCDVWLCSFCDRCEECTENKATHRDADGNFVCDGCPPHFEEPGEWEARWENDDW